MTFAGTFKNGVVIFDSAPELLEGTRVEILVSDPKQESPEDGEPTLKDLLYLAGTVKDLPSDMAAQHDHYIHGTPKR